MLERKIKQLRTADSPPPKTSPRLHYTPSRESDLESRSRGTSSDHEQEDPTPKERDKNNLRIRRQLRERSSSNSTYPDKKYDKSDPSTTDGERATLSSKEKAKELLRKNTAKLMHDSTKKRSKKVSRDIIDIAD